MKLREYLIEDENQKYMTDLTTIEGRQQALLSIMADFIADIHKQFSGFHESLSVRINDRIIEIGVHDPEKSNGAYMAHLWGSKLKVYPDSEGWGGELSPAKIKFGSSGSFSPKDTAEYWRTVHAYLILQNWSKFTSLVNQYCQKWTDLHQLIIETNKEQ